MAKSRFKKKKITTKKIILFSLLLLLIIAGVLFALEKTKVINFYKKEPTINDTIDKTTSTAPSAQEEFSNGDMREPGNTFSENEGTGSVEDLEGDATTQDDSAKWTASSTGEIVVHSPFNGQSLSNGTEISGTSSLTTVSYRLIDNVSGVITQGQLNVVSGKFAGRVNYSTSATEGRLDVFGTMPDGSEFSNTEIQIRF